MKTINQANLSYLSTGEPTFWPIDKNKIPDLLDFCIVKGIAQPYLNAKSCLDLFSDHSPVLISYSIHCHKIEKPLFLPNQKTDWDKFKNTLAEELNLNLPLKTERDIDDAVEHMTSLIQEACWSATPELET